MFLFGYACLDPQNVAKGMVVKTARMLPALLAVWWGLMTVPVLGTTDAIRHSGGGAAAVVDVFPGAIALHARARHDDSGSGDGCADRSGDRRASHNSTRRAGRFSGVDIASAADISAGGDIRRSAGPLRSAGLHSATRLRRAAGSGIQRRDPAAAGRLGSVCHAGRHAQRAVAARPVLPVRPGHEHGHGAEVRAARRPGLPLVCRAQRSATRNLGINDVELSVTFAFPLFHNSQTPLLVTPGFAVHYWEGPVSVLPVAARRLRRPTCRRAPTTPISTSAGIRRSRRGSAPSWTSASASTPTSPTSPATAFASWARAWPCSASRPACKLKAGVWYLDRVKVKMLPAGGICLDAQPRHLLQHPLSQSENRQAADHLGQHRVVDLRRRAITAAARGRSSATADCARPDPHRRHLRHVRLQRHPRRRGPGVQDAAATPRACSRSAVACSRELVYQSDDSPARLLSEQHRVSSAPGWRTEK